MRGRTKRKETSDGNQHTAITTRGGTASVGRKPLKKRKTMNAVKSPGI
jgi:hypothetical protein